MKKIPDIQRRINKHADLSRKFLKLHKVYRYRMKKISDMDDDEVNQKCHWYCEDNKLVEEWNKFVEENLNN